MPMRKWIITELSRGAVIAKQRGYRPRGQRGYQPQSSRPLDPMKLKPPTGGSAVQPPKSGPPAANGSTPGK